MTVFWDSKKLTAGRWVLASLEPNTELGMPQRVFYLSEEEIAVPPTWSHQGPPPCHPQGGQTCSLPHGSDTIPMARVSGLCSFPSAVPELRMPTALGDSTPLGFEYLPPHRS